MDTLKELTAISRRIEDEIINNNGELTPELESMLDFSESALMEKTDAYAGVFRRLVNAAEYFKAEADKSAKIARSLSKAEKNLKERMKLAIVELGRNEIQGVKERAVVSDCKKSLDIIGPVSPEYLIQVTELVPDKERIKLDLEAGVTIENCRLIGGKSIRFYPRKDI